MVPIPNLMLYLRYNPPEWQELSTQMQSQLHPTLKWEGRVIGLRIFVIDCLENKIFKQGCLEAEVLKKCFMTIFVIECMKQCFLFKSDQILW